MAKTREFYCDRCAIRMKIEVEPDYTAEDVKREYPEALEWLDKVTCCPKCGDELGE